MTARTIVGSGPARRPLPMGREAVERAIAFAEHWPISTEISPTRSPGRASGTAWNLVGRHHGGTPTGVRWLPAALRYETVDQLRERLRGMP